MPTASAPPMAIGAPAAYVGDNMGILFDGRYLWLQTALGNIPMSMTTLATINQYASNFVNGGSSSASNEYNVYCEETKKHHRAILVRELTLDEIYKGLK